MLKFVTITGADSKTSVEKLVEISKEFPYVEWGILLSESKIGQARFPDFNWLNKLAEANQVNNLNLSGHICQKWCRDIFIDGVFTVNKKYPLIWKMFNRIQLNFSPYDVKVNFLEHLSEFPNKQFIFQISKKNKDNLIEYSINKKLNTACLFDCSGGKGISPVNWPNIKENIFCGYAGGLGPDNIEAEIKKIILLTNNNDFWIDMESKVRTKTSDLDYLDLDKVKNCLIQVKKYV